MSEQPRILFLFSDTGGGHRSAAEAVIEALEGAYPNRFDIRLVDAFKEYAPRPLNYLPASYPFMVRSPRAWGLGYRISNGHGRARAMTGIAWPYVRAASRRLLAETKPDLVVSVHPVLVAPVIRALGHDRPPVLTIVTDLVTTHALWYHHRVDLCLVPTESARQRALAFGMRPEQVDVVGLPVSERFCQPVSDPLRLRQELGWPPDRPMVLVVGGGEGMGPLYEIARALASKGGNLGLAVVAGRNTRLQVQLETTPWEVPTFFYGFERRMPQMMQAASLLVTKAGPGTVTEALNAGLPMVLYGYLPGQEEGNVGYVVEQGVGLWAPGPERTATAVSSWLSRPEELKQAAATCRRIARPDAAKRVAEVIASTLSRRFPSPAPGAQSFRTPV